jgi:hypothetical protein
MGTCDLRIELPWRARKAVDESETSSSSSSTMLSSSECFHGSRKTFSWPFRLKCDYLGLACVDDVRVNLCSSRRQDIPITVQYSTILAGSRGPNFIV